MSDHRDATKLATATLLELIARGQALQAAVVRGASEQEIEGLRQAGMAVAEAYMDRVQEAARVVRSMIDGHPDRDKLGEEGAKRLGG